MVLQLKSISVLSALSLSLFFFLRSEIANSHDAVTVSDFVAVADGTTAQRSTKRRRLTSSFVVNNAAAPNTGVAPRTVVVAVNTPKTGTTGLTQSFVDSLTDCVRQPKDIKEFKMTDHFRCASEGHVIKSHRVPETVKLMNQIRSQQDVDQCLIVTAIRGPQQWLPSVFMQSESHNLCDATLTPEQLQAKMVAWLLNSKDILRLFIDGAVPALLAHYDASSLTEEFQRLVANGGHMKYSSAVAGSPFAGCPLLFLQVEQSQNWPELVAAELPGMKYSHGHGANDRKSKCPGIAEAYASLKTFELASSDRLALVDGVPGLEEYFRLYGYI